MDRTELAWAAGFWDGEGSAYLTGALHRATRQPQARVNQASSSGIPDVLFKFQRAVQLGRIQGPDIVEGREPLYRWIVSSRAEIFATYVALRPYLGAVKRLQFEDVLAQQRFEPDEWMSDPLLCRAWAAGLFDGEGSVYTTRHQSHAGYVVVEAAITQVSRRDVPEVLVRFRDITRIGKIYGPYPGQKDHDPVYRWKAHRRVQIETMISDLSAYLGPVKREQAVHAISLVAAQDPLTRGNPAWGSHKTHCVHGHEYATARLRPFKGRGKNDEPQRLSKQCLACVREQATQKRRETKDGGLRRRP
ncbi:MAG: hypothetical protein KGN00_12265 [Chloroflexota bacterium]|nr:hypothetical protein [Chloroflexota bacterium]MDE3194450.1 hypothetical protein [Chloroflexota bacterium]